MPTCHSDIIELPDEMVKDTPEDLREAVHDNFASNYINCDYLSRRAIMACTNKIVNAANHDMLQQIPGEMHVSRSIDTCVEEEHQTLHDEDFLNRLPPSGLPPHRLHLKVNSVIILIRNLSVRDDYGNSSRYLIQSMTDKLIAARRLNGSSEDIVLIPKIPMYSKESDFVAPFKRLQFLVISAYYLTFNRVQGQSLDQCGLLLPESVFSHGHLYVGLSRCGDDDNVFTYANQDEFDSIRDDLPANRTFTRNIVFTEIFDV